ncbi:hypothetical protein ACP70R_007844 [Stipagrostis hirtigluma subsp. patula]
MAAARAVAADKWSYPLLLLLLLPLVVAVAFLLLRGGLVGDPPRGFSGDHVAAGGRRRLLRRGRPARGSWGWARIQPICRGEGAFTWGNKAVCLASDAWGSSFLLSNKNGGGSGSFSNISDHLSSRGISRSSSGGSDLLDSPLASDRSSHPLSAADLLPSHNSTPVTNRLQSMQSRSGSLQYSHFQSSFSEGLKPPLRTIAKQGPTSHGKGFTLNADDFPVLLSKKSKSNSQKGCNSQGQPTSSSVSVAAQDEQRKSLITGRAVSSTNFLREAQLTELYGTQAPNMSESFGPFKPAGTPDSFLVESVTHNGQSLLNHGGEARHDPVPHDGYHPENRDSCNVHVPTDAFVISQPHHFLGEVKDNNSDTLKKQPVIKKDLVLLDKIKCPNMKARNLCARNMSEIFSCRESNVEYPKSVDLNVNHVAKDTPFTFGTVASDIASAFHSVNCVSESSNFVMNGPSNDSTNQAMIDLLEGRVTESSEARTPGKAAYYHVYGGGILQERCLTVLLRTVHLLFVEMDGKSIIQLTLGQLLRQIHIMMNHFLGTAHTRCM